MLISVDFLKIVLKVTGKNIVIAAKNNEEKDEGYTSIPQSTNCEGESVKW